MKTPLSLFLSVAACASALLQFSATGAYAQATKIFVASFGNDANDGSRGSPKRNFQPAHDAASASGQIVVLDTADYGALRINKSVSVTAPRGVNAFVTVSGTSDGVFVNAGSSGVVSLRGLTIEGGGSNQSGGTGITAPNTRTLSVEDCTVRNFRSGIDILNSSPNPQLFVYNTTVRQCGSGLGVVAAGNSNATTAVAVGCKFQGNSDAGLGVQTIDQSAVDVTLEKCEITNNAIGIRSVIARSQGNTVVRLSDCTVIGNATGLSSLNNGGQFLSRGNNTFENNGGAATFPGTYSAK